MMKENCGTVIYEGKLGEGVHRDKMKRILEVKPPTVVKQAEQMALASTVRVERTEAAVEGPLGEVRQVVAA